MRFKFSKKASFRYNLLALMFFIILAIWRFDLPAENALLFLMICLGFVLVIGIFAAILALIIRYVNEKRDLEIDDLAEYDDKNDNSSNP